MVLESKKKEGRWDLEVFSVLSFSSRPIVQLPGYGMPGRSRMSRRGGAKGPADRGHTPEVLRASKSNVCGHPQAVLSHLAMTTLRALGRGRFDGTHENSLSFGPPFKNGGLARREGAGAIEFGG